MKNKGQLKVYCSMELQEWVFLAGGWQRGGPCAWRPLPREGPSTSPVTYELWEKPQCPPSRALSAPTAVSLRPLTGVYPQPLQSQKGRLRSLGTARLASPHTREHESADACGLGRLVEVACLLRLGRPAEAELCSPSAFRFVHRTFETLGRFINPCCKSPLALGISFKLKSQTGCVSFHPGRLGEVQRAASS